MKKALSTIIVIAVIAVGIAFAYQTIFLSPEKVTKTAFEKIFEAKSYHLSGAALFSGKIKGIDMNNKVDIESDSDFADKKSPKSVGVLNLSVCAQGIQIMFSTEYKIINNGAYLRLVQIPDLFKKTKLPVDINKYNGLWIKIPLEKYKKTRDINSQTVMEEVENWIKEEKIFSNIKKLKPENINGNSCRHYMCVLNKEALLNLFKRLGEMGGKKTDEKTYAEAAQEFRKLKDINIELWIAKKNMTLNKIKISEVEIKPKGILNTLKISFEGTYSKYNIPINIHPPEVSINIKEIVSEFMKGFKAPSGIMVAPQPQNMPVMPHGAPAQMPMPMPTK